MANPNHVEKLKSGIKNWNQWRADKPDIIPDLSDIDLKGFDFYEANLECVDFRKALLGGAIFIGADLTDALLSESYLDTAWLKETILVDADISSSNLQSASFQNADLSGADFTDSILWDVDFRGADLFEVDFTRSDLCGAIFSDNNMLLANFSEALLSFTVFGDVDLSGALNIECAVHEGPSTIGIDTIYRSKGKISDNFLHEAGVTPEVIELARTLSNNPTNFYSCFISYSNEDSKFAERLYDDLRAKGIRCWFAPHRMKAGSKIRETLDKAIKSNDKLLLILSENSVNSEWVEKEVETAFEEERHKKITSLFPLRLDETVMDTDKPWAADIRRARHIADFRGWRRKALYQKALDKLISDLKKED